MLTMLTGCSQSTSDWPPQDAIEHIPVSVEFVGDTPPENYGGARNLPTSALAHDGFVYFSVFQRRCERSLGLATPLLSATYNPVQHYLQVTANESDSFCFDRDVVLTFRLALESDSETFDDNMKTFYKYNNRVREIAQGIE